MFTVKTSKSFIYILSSHGDIRKLCILMRSGTSNSADDNL